MLKPRYVLTCLALVSSLTLLPAQAELMIAPTRVVLENGTRSAELVLVNKGKAEEAFRISLENRRMRLDGSMEEADKAAPGELFATDYIRYSSRRVVMQPDENQTIRLTSQYPADLPPGEYRSHLRLMAVPTDAGRTLSQATNPNSKELSINLIAIKSLTIPVILRVGKLSADAKLESAKIEMGASVAETKLVARMTRTGDRSIYGDIIVRAKDVKDPVLFIRGVAIYTPNTERDVILPLAPEVRASLRGKEVTISYVSSDPANPATFAELRTVLN